MSKLTQRISEAWRTLVRRSKSMRPLRGRATAAGVTVVPENALQVMAVLTSVRIVAEAIGSLPRDVIMKRGRDRLPPPPSEAHLVRVLTVRPNPVMAAGEFWSIVTTWILLRGNAFVFVQRNNAGRVTGLWPVPPTDVTVKRTALGLLAYKLDHDGKETWLPVPPGYTATSDEILHYRWFGMGPIGLSPIGVARQQVGISVAATEYIGGFFERDATPETILTVQGNLTDKQWERLVEQTEDRHRGFDKSHNLAVFEGGAKLERISLTPADAQFLEIFKLTEGKIASMYGVPPHKIGDLDHATFSNIEHLSIEFVQDALLPPITRIEDVTAQLFTDPAMRFKFDTKGRMRGDTATQTAYYAAGRQWGFLSANDILALEDQPPIEGGDVYLEPINMIPAGTSPVQRSGLSPAEVPALTPTAYRAIEATAARSASDEAPAWVTRMRDTLAGFVAEQRTAMIGERFSDDDRATWDELLAETIEPVIAGIVADFGARETHSRGLPFDAPRAAAFVTELARSHARGFNALTFRDLAPLEYDDIAVFDVFDAAFARVDAATVRVIDSIASFGSHEGATQAGAVSKTWRSADDEHASMHGEQVPIADEFSNRARWPRDLSAGSGNAACACTLRFDYEE